MADVRVIPVLSLRRRGLVKTTRFVRPRYVGDPINVVRIFNDKEVDELCLLDIVASRERAEPDLELLEQIASEAFMPVTYGGGVRGVADATRILKLGIEKIAVNTAAFDDHDVVSRLAGAFGRQCVVVSVDVRRSLLGRYVVHSHAGRQVPETDPLRWIERLVTAGAGEILLNAVDRDGTMRGYDLSLVRLFRDRFEVPIVTCGGAAGFADMTAALAAGARDLGVGARFIYEGPYRAVLVSYLSAREMAELRR